MMDKVLIGESDFDPAFEYQRLRGTGPGTGAVATFTGLVRDSGDLQGVTGLYLEHYPGMTEQVIEGLIGEARQRWDLVAVTVIHRVGALALSDQIVFVGVASAHRSEAFAACQFLMDVLKTGAPFWKKELSGGGGRWVEQKGRDAEVARGWVED